MKNLCGIVLTVVLAGCVASGVQVSQDAALQFKEGVTTESEILAKLGRPTGTTISGGMKFISYSGFQSQAKGASFIPIVGAFAGGSDYAVSTALYQIDASGVMQKATYSSHGGSSRLGASPAELPSGEPRAVK